MLSTAGNGARQKRAQRIGFNRIIRCKKVRLCRKRKESRAAATSTGFRKLRFLQDPRRIHSTRQYRKALSRNLPHTAGNVIYDFRRNHDRCAGFNFPIAFLFSLFQKKQSSGERTPSANRSSARADALPKGRFSTEIRGQHENCRDIRFPCSILRIFRYSAKRGPFRSGLSPAEQRDQEQAEAPGRTYREQEDHSKTISPKAARLLLMDIFSRLGDHSPISPAHFIPGE